MFVCSHHTLTRKNKIKSLEMPDVGKGIEQFQFSCFHGKIVKSHDDFGKMFGSFLYS